MSQSQEMRYTSGAHMPVRRPGQPFDISALLALLPGAGEGQQQQAQQQAPQSQQSAEALEILRRAGMI